MSWENFEGGYERTRDKNLIRVLLDDLIAKAFWVQFVTKDFRSGPTILLSQEKKYLVFDLPRPWDPYLPMARVVYRDQDQILHFFRVKIVETDVKDKVVLTSFPTEVYRLERRSFYRIPVPEGSQASFRCADQELQADVINLSGSGMAILTPRGNFLQVGDIIEDIKLKLMISTGKPFDGSVNINRGRIVREQRCDRGRRLYGIKFLFEKEKEREPIIKYTLKRELEMRKASS